MALPYQEVPFKNKFGQIINPGDQIVIVTSGYGHSIYTKIGTFLGMRGRNCVVSTMTTVRRWDSATGWSSKEQLKRSTLQRNRIFPTSTPIGEFAGKGVF